MTFQGFSVGYRLPPRELFDWSLTNATQATVPNPEYIARWIRLFEINPALFHWFLEPKVPITIAAVYVVSVLYLNRFNEGRQNRPWNIAKTSTFKTLVLCHNIFLALFSGLVFYATCHILWNCWPQKTEPNILAHVADSLCRISGPVRPAFTQESWASEDQSLHIPLQRVWDNGYAYFCWLFYISKFYETVDTMIILAKGKKSSVLQTYHHAGVMLCMWSGARYMASPAIVGVVLNSGIHTCMYSYYALTSLKIPLPGALKQTLTSLQIAQFLVGGAMGLGYLFVEYDAPVYRSANNTTASASAFKDSMGKFDYHLSTTGNFKDQIASDLQRETEVQRVPCLQDSGQSFPVFITVLYLLPLIYLFVSFFRRSYLKRVKLSPK
ncbi:unnamed protein product [Penicillium olsonii]|nr:unnamed protein product [Penicillium olsonii]CAG7928544.1 unnamed protein product [Penicillium olsonii]